jgi:3-oxoacyl-[acyl-carrier-protein] synthase-1
MTVYITGDNIISSLGFTTEENMDHIFNGITGIHQLDSGYLSPEAFPAALVDSKRLTAFFSNMADPGTYTRLEQMMILSIKQAVEKAGVDIKNPRTLLIISTTKGNVELLEDEKKDKFPADRVYLWGLARVISDYFKLSQFPLIVSNACISGLLAIEVGARLIRNKQYDHVIVAGGDILTPFVVSGFQSFKSLSTEPCKPYDATRDGLSLGEACATVVLSSQKKALKDQCVIEVAGGASSNDANHISGPSRTGDGLYFSIKNALASADMTAGEIDFICAHGTATPYNDDMESKAVNLAGMQNVPLNSLKGYIGHTLGAAGAIESIMSIHGILHQKLIKTIGFYSLGVAEPINVISETQSCKLNNCLKVASGFGGCNAAVIFSVV